MSKAGRVNIEGCLLLQRADRFVAVDVEDTEDRASLVVGDGITGEEDALLRQVQREATGRVPGHTVEDTAAT